MCLLERKHSMAFRAITILLILFMFLDGTWKRGTLKSSTPFESYKLAALSVSAKLRIAALSGNEHWISAVREEALAFAQSRKADNVSHLDLRHQVAQFLKTIERNHNRFIPIQIATRATNFALFDEMEAFLKRELEFANAEQKQEEAKIYRLALYELLITKYFNPYKGNRSIFSFVDVQRFIRTVLFPTLSLELYQSEKYPLKLALIWREAYRSFLNGHPELLDESHPIDEQVDLFEDRIFNLMELNYSLPTFYPFLPSKIFKAQVIQVGLRLVIFGLHKKIGNLDFILNQFKITIKEWIQNTYYQIGGILARRIPYMFNVYNIPLNRSGRNQTGTIYEVFDKNKQRDELFIVPDDVETLLDITIISNRNTPIKPKTNPKLKTKGVLTQDGEIFLNLKLHDNNLHVLSTWLH